MSSIISIRKYLPSKWRGFDLRRTATEKDIGISICLVISNGAPFHSHYQETVYFHKGGEKFDKEELVSRMVCFI